MRRNNIPDGWLLKKLNQISTFESGGTPSKGVDEFWVNGDIKWLSAKYIDQDKIIGCDYITKQGLDNSSAKMTKFGDIILVTRVSVGKIVFVEEEFAVNQDLTIIKTDDTNKKFLFYVLKNKTKDIIDKSQGLAIKGITKEELSNIKVLVPPLPEQKKIAEILGTWDRAIEEFTGLIAEKKELKRGLMQRLLTGTQRLPGFYDDWEHERLGNMVNISSAGSKSQYIEEGGRYLIVDMGAVSNEARIIAKKQTNYTHDFLSCGDIVMPKDDIGGGNIIGKTVVIDADNKYILGDHVFKLRIKNTYEAKFISNLINSFLVNKYMRRMATGSAQLGLAKRDVEKCVLWLPVGPAEQKAIADVLSKADSEIDLLNQQLNVLREQKRGLMQKLLTGEIRVKVDNE